MIWQMYKWEEFSVSSEVKAIQFLWSIFLVAIIRKAIVVWMVIVLENEHNPSSNYGWGFMHFT